MKKLLVKNIGLLATPEGKSAHRGEEQGKIKFLKDAWVLIEDGIIASVGTGAVPAVEGRGSRRRGGPPRHPRPCRRPYPPHLRRLAPERAGSQAPRCKLSRHSERGRRHPVHDERHPSGQRAQELAAKASKALDEMMGFGTTTVEAKSGYGLATEHELKALEVIKDLNDHHRMDLVATFMGAHLVPAEYKSNREEYVRLVCEEMMPKVKEQGIAKFCDVFCEADTFTVEESRQVLEAGSQVWPASQDPRRRDRGHRRQPARR